MLMRRTGRIKLCVVTEKWSGNNLGGSVDKPLRSMRRVSTLAPVTITGR